MTTLALVLRPGALVGADHLRAVRLQVGLAVVALAARAALGTDADALADLATRVLAGANDLTDDLVADDAADPVRQRNEGLATHGYLAAPQLVEVSRARSTQRCGPGGDLLRSARRLDESHDARCGCSCRRWTRPRP